MKRSARPRRYSRCASAGLRLLDELRQGAPGGRSVVIRLAVILSQSRRIARGPRLRIKQRGVRIERPVICATLGARELHLLDERAAVGRAIGRDPRAIELMNPHADRMTRGSQFLKPRESIGGQSSVLLIIAQHLAALRRRSPEAAPMRRQSPPALRAHRSAEVLRSARRCGLARSRICNRARATESASAWTSSSVPVASSLARRSSSSAASCCADTRRSLASAMSSMIAASVRAIGRRSSSVSSALVLFDP